MRRSVALASVAVALALLVPAPPALASGGFTYTDSTQGCQTYTVEGLPAGGGAVSLTAVGAGGSGLDGGTPGSGGEVTAVATLSSGQVLDLCVNAGGASASNTAAGGGASGIAAGSNFASPLIVAGGGGGGWPGARGGDAGLPDGGSGQGSGGGSGGTATSGGSFDGMYSGSGSTSAGPGSGGVASYSGGDGGGGYYGGGGGSTFTGGGGGSDYCAGSVSRCSASLASAGASVTVQYLAAQTVAFPSTPVIYGQADFSPASASSGLAVTYTNASGQCSIDGAGLVAITAAGSCTVTANQAGDGSQWAAASPITQTFEIDRATVHVDAQAASVPYGQPDPAVSGTLRAADFVNGDTAAAVSGTPSCSISAHAADAGTYTGVISCRAGSLSATDYTFAGGTSADLTITRLTVHVDANPASITYGQADPVASATLRAADFADGEGAAVVSGAPSCSIAPHTAIAGTYMGAINCGPGTLSAANYTFVAGAVADLTIERALVHVDANPISVPYGQADPAPTGTLRAADLLDGDTSSVASGAPVCTIAAPSGAPGVHAGAITCQPGTLAAANYTFEPGAAAALTVTPVPPDVSGLTVAGTPRQGQTLTVEGQQPGIVYAYAWQDCGAAAAGCAPISGSQGATLALTGSEVGRVVRVVVTASAAGGSAQDILAPPGEVAGVSFQIAWAPGASASGATLDSGAELSCPAGGPACAATVRVTTRVAGATVTLGSRTYWIEPGATESGALPLNRRGRRLLAGRRRLTVRIDASGAPGGAASVTASKTVILRRAPARVSGVRASVRRGVITLHATLSAAGRVRVRATVLTGRSGTAKAVARGGVSARRAGTVAIRLDPGGNGRPGATLRVSLTFTPAHATAALVRTYTLVLR